MPLRTAVQTLPVSLKSLSLDSAGRLSHRRAVGPLHFTFIHHGRTYRCRFTERGPRAVVLLMHDLGAIDGLPITTRRIVRKIVRAARHEGVGLILRRNGALDLADRMRPAPPVQAHDLLAALSLAVVRAEPWLALLEDALAQTD